MINWQLLTLPQPKFPDNHVGRGVANLDRKRVQDGPRELLSGLALTFDTLTPGHLTNTVSALTPFEMSALIFPREWQNVCFPTVIYSCFYMEFFEMRVDDAILIKDGVTEDPLISMLDYHDTHVPHPGYLKREQRNTRRIRRKHTHANPFPGKDNKQRKFMR